MAALAALAVLAALACQAAFGQEPPCGEGNFTYNRCYGSVGCFDDCYPFDEFPFPANPSSTNNRFHLHTARDAGYEDYEIISAIDLGSRYNGSRDRTFLIVHDRQENREASWLVDLVGELQMSGGDYNIIVMDWRNAASVDPLRPLQPVAAGNTRVIAIEAYLLVEALRASRGLVLRDLHCVGFGHGAHACGFLGRRYNQQEENLFRVSGMDPSGGIFFKENGENTDVRMDEGDGDLVDAIHTHVGGSGIDVNTGDVDFWPHSGDQQPGCLVPSCNHQRAAQLWIASVDKCLFVGDFCNSMDDMRNGECDSCNGTNCQALGFPSDQYQGRGVYHITTRTVFPFC